MKAQTGTWGKRLVGLLGTALVAGLLGSAGPARAVDGDAVADGTHLYLANIDIAPGTPEARSCSGALVDPAWVITARDCFAGAGQPVGLGPPPQVATVSVGRQSADPDGHVSPVALLRPHGQRNVVLAKLAIPVPGVQPVGLGVTPPALGETLSVGGYGRTATEWRPQWAHAADFEVTAVHPATVDIAAPEPDQSDPCRGDAGGPALRQVGGVTQVLGIVHTSWQHGCLGETETRRGASLTRLDDIADWVRQGVADVSVFGVAADGRLTHSTIDSATGDRLGTVTSTASLGFVPKAMAVINYNTILVTTPGARLHRVDITSTNPLLFTVVDLDWGGWSHDHLAYDGFGSLFGIASSRLLRYTVTSAKPGQGTIVGGRTIADSGFSLRTLTAIGSNWIMGTTGGGELVAYRIDAAGANKWHRHSLATSGWTHTHLMSPGAGLYYGRTTTGGMLRYRDANPLDGSGTDIQSFPNDPVDTTGWNQVLLSAEPFNAFPHHLADVSVFGVAADGRLTHSTIDSATGDRLGTVTSTASLGFVPKAMAVINYNTILVTNNSRLHRVDITSTNPLMFTVVDLDWGGWSHDHLAYDGFGSLFGIASSRLLRYTITSTKPGSGTIINGTTVADSGFSLRTLTATGPNWIMGTTGSGELVAYKIDVTATNKWQRHSLAASGWTHTHLMSPGIGLYYGRTTTGGMLRYRDANPLDGKGTDIQSFPSDPVDTTGWNQVRLSVQPFSTG